MRAIIAGPEPADPEARPSQAAGPDDGTAATAEPAADIVRIDASGGRGERVDRFLAARLDGISRTRVQQWIALGAVHCEQRALTASTRLRGDEELWVEPQPREADGSFAADPVDLDFVHEDEDLLIVDKPAGLVVHPGAGNWRGTLMNGLLHHRPALARLPRAGIVHRLDRDTSGLLMVAKSERAFLSLTEQLADRSAGRRYLALVAGRCRQAGTIDAPIGRDPDVRVRMAIVTPPRGRNARTHYRSLAQGSLADREVSLLECRLDTGRTHQIRVHLQHIGHPLVGDPVYRGTLSGISGRQALHARELRLRHPADGRLVRFRSPLPEDFRTLLKAAGIDAAAIEAADEPADAVDVDGARSSAGGER